MMNGWHKGQTENTSLSKKREPTAQKIQFGKLKKELRETRLAHYVLKKAVHIFSKSDNYNMNSSDIKTVGQSVIKDITVENTVWAVWTLVISAKNEIELYLYSNQEVQYASNKIKRLPEIIKSQSKHFRKTDRQIINLLKTCSR